MRIVATSMIGVLWCGTAALACPDAALSPGAVRYDAAALAAVPSLAVQAGGDVALDRCDLGMLGFAHFRAAPDHSFVLADAPEMPLVLSVTSQCDAALLVRTGQGRWLFNDDGNGSLDPRVTLSAAQMREGQVDLWVGGFAGDSCDARLEIAEAAMAPAIQRAGPGPMAAMPLVAANPAAPQPIQAQLLQPAPLPIPVPVPGTSPAPIPAPIPVPVPVPLPTAICPDPNLVGPSLAVTGAQLLTPQGYVAQVGGQHELESCPEIEGWGMANEAPSFTLTLSEMGGYLFTVETVAECDPTLILRDALGQWHFNDDGPNGLQPLIEVDGGRLNGRVDVWVGGFAGSSCTGTIVFRTAAATAPTPGGGCPNPVLQGRPVTTTGDALYNPQLYEVIAGGTQDVATCNLPLFAAGYVSAEPSLSFFLSGMQDYARLEIQGEAACDTVLLVRTPDGMWHFDDDTNGGMNPMLNLDRTSMLNGRVDVWVGSYSAGTCPATIEMETWAN